VVIYAAAKFRCRHRYISTVERERLLFVCDQCHHRTELLSLDLRIPHRGVRSFTLPGASRWDEATTIGKSAA